MKKKELIVDLTLGAAFGYYVIFALWQILLKRVDFVAYRKINLTPFFDAVSMRPSSDFDVYGNVIFFVPLGIFVAVYLKNLRWWQKPMLPILVSIIFETLQYIFALGITDITDVITNGIGGVLGILLVEIMRVGIGEKTLRGIVAGVGVVAMVATWLVFF